MGNKVLIYFVALVLCGCNAVMEESGGDDPSFGLQNLLILNFGPYDPDTGISGDFEFISNYSNPFFDEFGRVHSAGTPAEYHNPTFEYKVPRDTKVYFPISGYISSITWQPTESYKQDDWELVIKPTLGSNWLIVIDHVTSIDCDRSSMSVCNNPIVVNGQELSEGSEVNAGDLLGYVGNTENSDGSQPFGRTEITIGEYIIEGNQDNFISYCPTNYLVPEIKDQIRAAVSEIMESYESWSRNPSFYDQEAMVAPGCLYTKIYESQGETTPIP
ncbi:MAG TPA: hypothetical protein QF720_01375 [Nitrospinota bacterium]|nr:hypothetical protein [Nitrospinota bacterium]